MEFSIRRRSTRENLYWQGSRTVIREGRCKILKGLARRGIHTLAYFIEIFLKHTHSSSNVNTIFAKKLSIYNEYSTGVLR